MNEPFQILKIEDGILQIGFHIFLNMGSWNVTHLIYNFRHVDEEFRLTNAERIEFNRATHNYSKYHFNFITKIWILEKGNDNEAAEPVIQKHKIEPEKLKSLEEVGQPPTWEIANGVCI